MKKNKYKIKKWVLIPLFTLIIACCSVFMVARPVNAYVGTNSLGTNYRSLVPSSVYVENTSSSYDYGYNLYPYSTNLQQYYLPQIPTKSVSDIPYINDNILYDNYSYSHRIIGQERTYLYGLDEYFYTINSYNPFITENNLSFVGQTYYLNGAYGSSDVLGGVLSNLSTDNIYLQMNFEDFNIPIAFLANETYQTRYEFSDIMGEIGSGGISEAFPYFYSMQDWDTTIPAYSICGLYGVSYDVLNGGTISPLLKSVDVSITYLNTAPYGSPSGIGLKTHTFNYSFPANNFDGAYLPYISILDILHYFISNEINVQEFGSTSFIYVSHMEISLDYGNIESVPIQNICISSIYSSEIFSSSSEPGVFFGDNWRAVLNNGEIGGNTSYELDLSSWLVSAVGAFMNAELFPGFFIGGIFAVMVAFPLVIWFLKLVLGG